MLAVSDKSKANKIKLSEFSNLTIVDHFPESNPKDAMDDIVNGMRHAGILDGIKCNLVTN